MNNPYRHGWRLARVGAWTIYLGQLGLAFLAGGAAPNLPTAALASLQTNSLLRHIQRLASDECEGRAPASRGEELAVNYLVEQFQRFGLKPGNPFDSAHGGYVQSVPLMGVTSEATMQLDIGGQAISLAM